MEKFYILIKNMLRYIYIYILKLNIYKDGVCWVLLVFFKED